MVDFASGTDLSINALLEGDEIEDDAKTAVKLRSTHYESVKSNSLRESISARVPCVGCPVQNSTEDGNRRRLLRVAAFVFDSVRLLFFSVSSAKAADEAAASEDSFAACRSDKQPRKAVVKLTQCTGIQNTHSIFSPDPTTTLLS